MSVRILRYLFAPEIGRSLGEVVKAAGRLGTDRARTL